MSREHDSSAEHEQEAFRTVCLDEKEQDRNDADAPATTSALQYVQANFQQSSHSLADTQFTDDAQQFLSSDSSRDNLGMDAEIRSWPLPHDDSFYYTEAGNPNGRLNEEQIPIEASPRHTDVARPNWRRAAVGNGMAGSFYDYSTRSEHLSDRLFFQAQIIAPSTALVAASQQAIQECHALVLENQALQKDVDFKEAKVARLRDSARAARSKLAAIEARNDNMQAMLKKHDKDGRREVL